MCLARSQSRRLNKRLRSFVVDPDARHEGGEGPDNERSPSFATEEQRRSVVLEMEESELNNCARNFTPGDFSGETGDKGGRNRILKTTTGGSLMLCARACTNQTLRGRPSLQSRPVRSEIARGQPFFKALSRLEFDQEFS
jgi:hypothetical protein